MTELEMQDVLARVKRSQAETDKFVDEGRKLRAEAGKLERERTTLVMTAGAAILGAGAVLGGLIVRLLTGH
jgi:hypothetical protein